MDAAWGVAGFAAGAAIGWLLAASRAGASRAEAEERRRQAEALSRDLEEARRRLEEAGQQRAAAEARLKSAGELEERFRGLAAEAMRLTQEQFLRMANEKLADREKAIQGIVAPVRESLEKVEKGLTGLETQRAAIKEHVEHLAAAQAGLQRETGRLAEALKSSTTRGRWGEVQLQRVVELAGMTSHCDFVPQASVSTEEGRLRPDLVVRLPGGKSIVVDAKAPLDAFLRALESKSDEERGGHLKQHAQEVKTHLSKLGQKQYHDQFEASPEFVVLFLPGEAFFSAALEQDPELIDYGAQKRVILATPTTLIALLKAVHYGWKQQDMAENARKIGDAGRELHDRIAVFLGHFARLASALDASVEAYNKALGSMEQRVMPAARRLAELGAEGTKPAAAPPALEKLPRAPQAAEIPRE